MNNQYQHRWWIVAGIVLLMLLISYFFILQPAWQNVIKAKKATERAAEKARLKKQTARFAATVDPPKAIDVQVKTLFSLIRESGLQLLGARFMVPKTSDWLEQQSLHINLQGRFIELVALLSSLQKESPPMFIRQFTYQTLTQDQLKIALTIALFKLPARKQPASYSFHIAGDNPFCHASQLSNPFSENQSLLSFSINEMRLIGYIEQGNQQAGWLQLPTNEVLQVTRGMLIGKERGIIRSIQPDRMIVQFQKRLTTVILSAAKDLLINSVFYREILRCAQDDSSYEATATFHTGILPNRSP